MAPVAVLPPPPMAQPTMRWPLPMGFNEMDQPDRATLPESATRGAVAGAGLAAFIVAVSVLYVARPFGGNLVASALFAMGASAAAIALVDLLWQKVHRRASTGLDFAHDDPSWERSLTKLLGLLGSLGFIGILYWLFPEYHGLFYERYFAMLRIVLPAWILVALPYLYYVDRHMLVPRDGYWHMGRWLLLDWRRIDWGLLWQHLLGWLIKGFFLALMFTYLCNDLGRFLAYDFTRPGFIEQWFDFLYDSCYFIDVALVSMGYLMSLRLTDTHLRSAEPTMLGWAAALVCYDPFWALIGRQYLSYQGASSWVAWLGHNPILYGLWGLIILMFTVVYVWATVVFGARFSNLTHRGIITNGPYRWTKHPAYVAKNLSWWLISVPFLVRGSPMESLRHCALLLGLNGIYLLRAKTEEWHLSRDPDYRRYAAWIAEHGIFRRRRRPATTPA
jgi:steroid 5-alpha reductase family enzyme